MGVTGSSERSGGLLCVAPLPMASELAAAPQPLQKRSDWASEAPHRSQRGRPVADVSSLPVIGSTICYVNPRHTNSDNSTRLLRFLLCRSAGQHRRRRRRSGVITLCGHLLTERCEHLAISAPRLRSGRTGGVRAIVTSPATPPSSVAILVAIRANLGSVIGTV